MAGKIKDYDILIGYIKEFSYKSPDGSERMSGHPQVGRLYRIIKDPHGYRLHIGKENNLEGLDGLFLGKTLKGDGPQYAFNIDVVTPENYLDLELDEADLDKLATWINDDHSDLWELVDKEISGEHPVIRTGNDLIKLLSSPDAMRAITKQVEEEPKSSDVEIRHAALEATLNLLICFKKKSTQEIAELFDLMYTRIYNTLKG